MAVGEIGSPWPPNPFIYDISSNFRLSMTCEATCTLRPRLQRHCTSPSSALRLDGLSLRQMIRKSQRIMPSRYRSLNRLLRATLKITLLLTGFAACPPSSMAQLNSDPTRDIKLNIVDDVINPHCDAAGHEIVVCGKRRDVERYRIPSELRDSGIAASDDRQANLGPSMMCDRTGNVRCAKAAIPIITSKGGHIRVGPITSR